MFRNMFSDDVLIDFRNIFRDIFREDVMKMFVDAKYKNIFEQRLRPMIEVHGSKPIIYKV